MTAHAFTQMSGGRWPSGDSKVLNHLTLEPDEISDRLGIAFSDGADDLGAFVEAGIRLTSGRMLLFLKYKDPETSGTSVLADAEDNVLQAQAELDTLLRRSV